VDTISAIAVCMLLPSAVRAARDAPVDAEEDTVGRACIRRSAASLTVSRKRAPITRDGGTCAGTGPENPRVRLLRGSTTSSRQVLWRRKRAGSRRTGVGAEPLLRRLRPPLPTWEHAEAHSPLDCLPRVKAISTRRPRRTPRHWGWSRKCRRVREVLLPRLDRARARRDADGSRRGQTSGGALIPVRIEPDGGS
jgi:hypothetical protein